MKCGDLVRYNEEVFRGKTLLGIIVREKDYGTTDYVFYDVLLTGGKILTIADTRLTPV